MQRAAARAKETEAEGRLRQLHEHVLELRSKARPVEEYAASDRAEQLQKAVQALEGARKRMEQYEKHAQVRAQAPLGLLQMLLCIFVDATSPPDAAERSEEPNSCMLVGAVLLQNKSRRSLRYL